MELTSHNVSSLEGGEIAVHFLKSKDGYTYGMCFKKVGTETVEVIWYTTVDPRGPVSVFLPISTMNDNAWDTRGVARKIGTLDHSLWSESTYVFGITSAKYIAYQEWLIGWMASATSYSLFDGGRTSRVFMAASLAYFELSERTLSLLGQEVTTISMTFVSKVSVSVVELHDVQVWYDTLRSSSYSIEAIKRNINETKLMYYREKIDGMNKLWKLTGVVLLDVTEPLYSRKAVVLPQVQLISLADMTIKHTPPPVTLQQLPPPPLPPRNDAVTIIIFLIVLVAVIIIIVVFVWHINSTPALAIAPAVNTLHVV